MERKKGQKLVKAILKKEMGLLDFAETLPLPELGTFGQKIQKVISLIKKQTDKKLGLELRNAEEFKHFIRRRWIHRISLFPEQEKENSTLIIAGSSDFRYLVGLGINTDFVITYAAGGIACFTGCGISKQNICNTISEEMKRILLNKEIDKVFLVSSYPFSNFLKADLESPEYWEIRNCIIWLAQAREFMVNLNPDIQMLSFLLYNHHLCLVNHQKVLAEKIKYKNTGT
ncbi:MAG TPA: hypothetical protein PKH95_01080 [Candidatus Magasanikbacteria bacterium]|nr:hypothetical protein [Candidatus Magasanikbacteria bacterium]